MFHLIQEITPDSKWERQNISTGTDSPDVTLETDGGTVLVYEHKVKGMRNGQTTQVFREPPWKLITQGYVSVHPSTDDDDIELDPKKAKSLLVIIRSDRVTHEINVDKIKLVDIWIY